MKHKSLKKQVFARFALIGVLMLVLATTVATAVFAPRELQATITDSENNNREIIKQLENLLKMTDSYIENLALSVSHNAEIQNYFDHPDSVTQNIATLALNNLTSYEGVVRAVAMEISDVPSLDSLNRICGEDRELLESDWYRGIEKDRFNRTVSPVYQVQINSVNYYTVAYVRTFYQNNRWCTFVVFLSLNDIIYDSTLIGGSNADCFALRNKDRSIFYSVGNEKYLPLLSEPDSINKEERMRSAGGVLSTVNSANNVWSVVSFVSNKTILKMLVPYIMAILAAIAVCLLLTLVAVSKSIETMLKPIIRLSQVMDHAAKGNLDSNVDVDRDDEIGLLETSYNKMIDDLRHSIRVIAEKEKKAQQAKFSLLVSQIDPHFICNTINSINYLARRGRCEDIVKVNTALTAIIRDRLRMNDIQVTDTIEEEMGVIGQYLTIEKFMYGGDLEVVWDVDDELKQQMIPKNMIQPLVENALFHGLIDEETGQLSGRLTIKISRTEDGIDLCVMDNGLGMDEERLQNVLRESRTPDERGNKIGLSNIRKRLYYFFGNDDAMSIASEPNKGTAITLHLPANPEI